MKISVVIPTYNRASTLRRCLDSVYSQTQFPDEVIVVDDGSTDDSAGLIQEYPRVVYLSQSNQGVSAARNAGISVAKNEWIALLDSDDEWLPEKLPYQQALLSESKLLVCHTEEIWIRNGVRVNQMAKHRKHGGDVFNDSLKLCAMSPSSIILHRSLLEEFDGFDPQFIVCEDYDLWLQIAAKYQVAFVEKAMIRKYGGHMDQLSRRYFAMDQYRIMAMEKLLLAGSLNERQKESLMQVLRSKLSILLKGAVKHDNVSLIHFCERIERLWLADDNTETA